MKYLIGIFAIYLMGMMLFPCSDAYNECKPLQAKVNLADDHSHRADANDNCSPFCNCNCCQTTIIAKFLAQELATNKTAFEERQFTFANQRFVSNYHGNIWQPPKINA